MKKNNCYYALIYSITHLQACQLKYHKMKNKIKNDCNELSLSSNIDIQLNVSVTIVVMISMMNKVLLANILVYWLF